MSFEPLDSAKISYCLLPTGHSIAYRVLGPESSPKLPFVLIQGLSGVGLVDWYPLANSMSSDRPVVVFDNRDIGWSKPPPKGLDETITLDEMANDVVELIKYLDFRAVDILGFSMGGAILQLILLRASELPFKIHHAILASTFAVTPTGTNLVELFLPSSDEKSDETAEQRKYRTTKKLLEAQYDAAWLANPKNFEKLEQRVEQTHIAKRPVPVILRQALACQDIDLRASLSNISKAIRLLSIHGTTDEVVGFAEQAIILSFIRHAQVVKTPGAAYGHFWFDYFGLEFWTKVLADFLDDQNVERSKL
ncbi:hypothetical protein CROQUDRAFT_663587 [Cronartium quercuum f. sp. fusiforme G11]|uniref:AB hydrolase-1 domain-containing protein n=1 Tax=Cronartium quercuum f. sp. fusiforme G11 TaxID=708437 RepID=A0A9P6N823_9BASI|nr:hypothetical protein CROQUDRAFT_663587 [Cronartium quercuum f. sp. fusiforme G11]